MKRIQWIAAALVGIGILVNQQKMFASSVESHKSTVGTNGITRTVTYVEADFQDPHYQLIPVLANNHIKSVASLSNIAKSVQAVAAINGGYFNSYTDNQPQGTLERNGQFQVALGATLMGVTATNTLTFVPGSSKAINGWINDNKAWDHTFYAWGLNNDFKNEQQIVIFTPVYGSITGIDHGACIVVQKGKITNIRTGNTYIPSDGYVIYFGTHPNANNYVKRFHYGDTIQYEVQIQDHSGNPVDWSSVSNALSAGPLLVQNGKVVVDPKGEGFTDPKVTQAAATRSFIGATADHRLMMGTVPDVTVYQLAPILQKLGLKDAMCLDDGASSGLYYNGSYLTTPGRDLSNAVCLVYNSNPAPNLMVDGTYVFLPHPNRMIQDRTFVPLRDFFDHMTATVSWNASDQSITIVNENTKIWLQIQNRDAIVNGKTVTLDVAPVILNDTTYIPVRFVAEALGKTVTWNGQHWAVEIK